VSSRPPEQLLINFRAGFCRRRLIAKGSVALARPLLEIRLWFRSMADTSPSPRQSQRKVNQLQGKTVRVQ